MAGSLNKVLLIGRLGADPEIKQMVNGKNVARLSLATSQSWKDKNTGEKKEKTEWHRVSLFGKLAEVAGEYLRKGSQVYIEGQLQTRKWTDNNGVDKYTTEVVIPNYSGVLTMLDSRSQSSVSDENTSQLDSAADEALGGSDNSTAEQLDDDIPF